MSYLPGLREEGEEVDVTYFPTAQYVRAKTYNRGCVIACAIGWIGGIASGWIFFA